MLNTPGIAKMIGVIKKACSLLNRFLLCIKAEQLLVPKNKKNEKINEVAILATAFDVFRKKITNEIRGCDPL